jgi:hypothetical protein
MTFPWKSLLPYGVLALIIGVVWLGYAHGTEIMRFVRFGGSLTPEVKTAIAAADEAARQAQIHASAARRNQALADQAVAGARDASAKAEQGVKGYAMQAPLKDQGRAKFAYVGQVSSKGEPEGLEVVNFDDGSRYEGGWKAGVPEGYGVMTYAGPNVHAGEWKAGVNLGDGRTLANGLTWEGQLMETSDLSHTYWGMLTCSANEACRTRTGSFKLTAGAGFGLDGPGVVVMKDGRQLKGMWKNGELEGYGAVLDAKGVMLEQGKYQNGTL